MKKENIGSSFDAFLEEEGIKEEVDLLAQKAIISRRIATGLVRRNMTQTQLAEAMDTSRMVVHRLLDPKNTSTTLATLAKASKALGLRLLRVAEVDAGWTEEPPLETTARRPAASPHMKRGARTAMDLERGARDSRKGLHKTPPTGHGAPNATVPKGVAAATRRRAAKRSKGPDEVAAPQPKSAAAGERHSKRSAARLGSRG